MSFTTNSYNSNVRGNIPIAFVDGLGKKDDTLFYSQTSDYKHKKKTDFSPLFKGGATQRKSKSDALNDALFEDVEPEDEEMKKAYNKVRDIQMVEFPKTVELTPIIDKNKRSSYYIFGAPGAGKSFLINQMVSEYQKHVPDAPIFMISEKELDESLKDIKGIKRIVPDEEIHIHMNYNDFPEGSVMIGDDFDAYPDKVWDSITKLFENILNVGRAKRIHILITSHMGSNYKKTRSILNTVSNVIYFNGGSFAQNNYVLRKYVGLSALDVKELKKVDGRWVMVGLSMPQVILWPNGVRIAKTLDKDYQA